MRRFALFGPCFIAMLALAASSGASSASAVEWVSFECHKVVPGTGLWKDAKCKEPFAGGEFERFNEKGLANRVASTSTGIIELEDMAALGGAVKVKCEIKDKGSVGPAKEDEITEIVTEKCALVAGKSGACTALVAVVALNLPWKTELFEVGVKIRDHIRNGGKGEPGWLVECNTVIGKVDDTCTGETSVGMEEGGEGVLATFDAESAAGNCTQGGAGQGLIEGNDLIKIEGILGA